MEEEVKNYEIGFLVASEQNKEELEKTLESHQLSIIDPGQVSKTKLAYPIKKESFAYFGFLYFSGASENVERLKNELKMNAKILRYLIISRPTLEREESSKRFTESFLMAKKSLADQRTSPETSAPSRPIKKAPARTEVLTNEALEKKLEEILQ